MVAHAPPKKRFVRANNKPPRTAQLKAIRQALSWWAEHAGQWGQNFEVLIPCKTLKLWSHTAMNFISRFRRMGTLICLIRRDERTYYTGNCERLTRLSKVCTSIFQCSFIRKNCAFSTNIWRSSRPTQNSGLGTPTVTGISSRNFSKAPVECIQHFILCSSFHFIFSTHGNPVGKGLFSGGRDQSLKSKIYE